MLRVIIAGGGLGGLTLAHALANAGLQPLVLERGSAAVDLSSSYRIHIDAAGSRALHTCLPPRLWQHFQAHAAAAPRGIAFLTERLQRLAYIPDVDPTRDPVGHAHPISRSGLRQLLLEGLQDIVQFDSRVVGYTLHDDHVVVQLADGRAAMGDLLVGADGSGSAVRKQLVPGARIIESGAGGIAGKILLDERTRALIGARLLSQMTMVLPVRGMAMFMAPFQRPGAQDELDLPQHLFWVLIGRVEAFGDVLHRHTQGDPELGQMAQQFVHAWHPLLGKLIEATDPSSLTAVPLHTAGPVDPWPTGRVTLLGDAIHTMTPLQGLGGNTALRDAALLADVLARVARRELGLLDALRQYETAMRDYGFDAVRRSLQVSDAVASSNVLGRIAFRSVLRVVDHVPALRERMFGRPA